MATARRYQSDQRAGTPQGRDPFSYAQGIRTPAAPNIPMPPRPSAAPPGPPRIYEPRITPAQAQFEGQAKIASQLSQVLGDWGDRFYKRAAAEAEQSGLQAGTLAGGSGAIELSDEDTIFANAFNKGVMKAYEGQLQLDAKQTLSGYALKYPADVDTYDRMVETYKVNTLKQQSDPQIQAYTRQKIDEYAFQYRNKILETSFAREKELSEAIWNESLYELEDDLQRLTKTGDKALITNKALEIGKHLTDGVLSGFVTGDEAFDKRKTLDEDAQVMLYLSIFEEESRADNQITAYFAFRNNDDLPVSETVRKRVESEMQQQIKETTEWDEKHNKRLEKALQAKQMEVTAIGLQLYGNGELTRTWVNKNGESRALNNTQYNMLLRLVESSENDIRSRMNAGVELELWHDIHSGIKNSEIGEITDRITNAVAAGIAPNTGASMFKTLADPNYDAVTNTEEYKLAVGQIRTIVGKSKDDNYSFWVDDTTAQSVAAAERKLFELMRRHPDKDPLDIVDPIINDALKHLGRNPEAALPPEYAVFNGNDFDLEKSKKKAMDDFYSGALDYLDFIEAIEELHEYRPTAVSIQTTNEKIEPSLDAQLLRQEQEAAGAAARANQ
tara:strand:- start:94 stop:1935 length:1842 start_codon:yes stop_codon:yes gene_type:complete